VVLHAQIVHAQLLSYQKAESYSSTMSESSPAYKIGYRQILHDGWSATFDYINEGHYTGHHADGYDVELWYWYRLPFRYPMSLSVGAGSFYYFDTITLEGTPSIDAHGFAPMVSFTLRGKLWWGRNWDWLASADAITPSHDIKAEMISLGVGYWLSPPAEPGGQPMGILDLAADASEPDEVSVYGVFDVVNISGNPNSWGAGVEYRHGFARHFEATLTYLYEGDPKVTRRSGVTAQLWPVRADITNRVEVGAGFGAYIFVDRKHQPIPNATSAAVAPVVSLMASFPRRNGFVRLIWDRVVSNYSRDADIWRVGVGHSL
jgi:hypothetical protein